MLDKLFNKLQNAFLKNKKKYCPVCQSKVEYFIPLPDQYRGKVIIKNKEYLAYKEAETLNADEYSCPHCGAADRERLYTLFLKNFYFKEHCSEEIRMVHFAPEASLKNYLKTFALKEYRTADLMMEGVDDKADLTDLVMYQDNYFDFFICSHMLEHVVDDIKAMEELYRILKPKGTGILIVPILEGLNEIYEDSSIVSEKDRLLHFGQEDHVRMYNKVGYLKRLKNIGFNVKEYSVNDFSKKLFKKVGITYKSILYVVEK